MMTEEPENMHPDIDTPWGQTTPTPESVKALADGLTKAQRRCGDLLDSFPCVECGAADPDHCPLPTPVWAPVVGLLNRTPGLRRHLLEEVDTARAHIGASHD